MKVDFCLLIQKNGRKNPFFNWYGHVSLMFMILLSKKTFLNIAWNKSQWLKNGGVTSLAILYLMWFVLTIGSVPCILCFFKWEYKIFFIVITIVNPWYETIWQHSFLIYNKKNVSIQWKSEIILYFCHNFIHEWQKKIIWGKKTLWILYR